MSLSNQYRSYGLNCVPCNALKYPTLKEYTQYYTTPYTGEGFDGAYGIGLLCGNTSGNLEVIDIDSKYQEHRDLFGGLKELVCNIDADLWEKLVIEQSPSGGYHLFFRCEKIAGNQKLANRPANEAEIEAAKASGSKAPKQVVLIETRGEGGIIVCAPTPGYVLQQLDFSTIPTISIEEREILMYCAKSFNEVHVETPVIAIPQAKKVEYGTDDVPCWVDYNNRHTCLDLLVAAGWRVIGQSGDKIHILRPGSGIKSQKSATFFPSRNKVVFFTSSSEFETWNGKGTAYSPFKIYALWHHGGDGKAAAKDLYAQGYGSRKKPTPTPVAEKKTFDHKVIKSEVNAEKKTAKTKLTYTNTEGDVYKCEIVWDCEEFTEILYWVPYMERFELRRITDKSQIV